MKRYLRYIPDLMAVFMAVIFLDSLRFKFTDHPNTQEIFGRLDGWAGTLGAAGLFAHTGLFSQAGGALAGLLVMTGAVSFHLFTPLGIDPNNDGAGLFVAACVNLAFAALLLGLFRRDALVDLLRRVARVIEPSRA
jgi:hypothetical protein